MTGSSGGDAAKAQAAIAMEDWPAAEKALRRLAKTKGAGASVFYNLAKVLEAQAEAAPKRAAQAEHWLERAVAAEPAHAKAWYELGRRRLASDAFSGAADAFARAAAADPRDVDAWRAAAQLFERLGRWRSAEEAWRALAATSPEDLDAALGCARAAFEQGRADAAEALMAEIAARFGDAAAAKLFKLRTSVARGRVTLG